MRTFFFKYIIFAMEQMKSLFESIEKPIDTDDPWENFKRSPLFNLGTIAETKRIPQDKPKPKKITDKEYYENLAAAAVLENQQGKGISDLPCSEVVLNLRKEGKEILMLPFSNFGQKDLFKHVLYERKYETRFIYPNNKYKYVINENGEEIPRHYDYLYLINGKSGNVPKAIVEVVRSEIFDYVDDNGNQIFDVNDDGTTYPRSEIYFYLGNIIKKENI